ncbi:MAG: membrane protein insertase YidC [Bacteroidales bacterium]
MKVDRNQIIGFILIGLIFFAVQYYTSKTNTELKEAQRIQDSIATSQRPIEELVNTDTIQASFNNDSTSAASANIKDSVFLGNKYGSFSVIATGKQKYYTLENNVVKLTISSLGGRVVSTELKNYKSSFEKGANVILFNEQGSNMNFNFTLGNAIINTNELYFSTDAPQSIVVPGEEVDRSDLGKEKYNEKHGFGSESIEFTARSSDGKAMTFKYTLQHNSYMLDFDVLTEGFESIYKSNANRGYLGLTWGTQLIPQERPNERMGEDYYTDLYYKLDEGDVEKIEGTKSSREDIRNPINWIGYKQQFFSAVLTNKDKGFNSARLQTVKPTEPGELPQFVSDIDIKEDTDNEYNLAFYFGPNHFYTLKQYKTSMERLVYLGYAIVRPVNQWLVIPVFNFLNRYIGSYGLIILILTLLIKTIIFPFTYKTYQSQAKMRVLKPEIDAINEKYPKEKALERQQATMSLYKKVGVNPLGGCLPMLFQMPVLIAMFFFFPSSIELRQQEFLWVNDLSSFDDFVRLPFDFPFLGNYLSLFCVLMTITSIFSTKLNSQNQTSEGMPGMKMMMYFMPVMFLFIFNSYAAGLSYYYLLSNLITIAQVYIVRAMIDEDAVRAKLMMKMNSKTSSKKPKKKSRFVKMLEEAQKRQEEQMRKNKKR